MTTKSKRRSPRKRTVTGWWFCAEDKLPNGDGRPVKVGETHTVTGKIVPCERGLHASKTVWDALSYANGNILYRVRLSGIVKPHGNPADKYAASKRTYLARIDAEPILRAFARRCALDVIDKWEAPEVVRKYLETGDEALRDAAWAAARDAAGAAARDAAWAAAWAAAGAAAWAAARDAALDAAWDAARDAARAAARAAAGAAAWAAVRDAALAAAWDAARAAARAAAIKKYSKWLEKMCLEAVNKGR